MIQQVNVREARDWLSQLLRAVQAGDVVVIANRGEPVVRLVPAAGPLAEPDVGSAAVILEWLRTHRLPPYARRSAEEIDATIQEERAW